MNGERYVVVGLAKVRSPWFTQAARWANSSQLPMEFLKCVSAAEVRSRIGSGRPVSAIVVDAGAPGVDRDLIDLARGLGTVAIVVDDERVDRDWIALGATIVLAPDFDCATLLDGLTAHAQPIRSASRGVAPAGPAEADDARSPWRGRLVAVTGGSGAGASTVSMALSQGLAAVPGHESSVVLADLAGRGDLAMYHDVRDVLPGVQELTEAHRTTRPTRSAVRQMLFEIDNRGYALLLGLRRTRDWTVVRPRALEAAIDTLLTSFRLVVTDIRPEFDGEDETGSVDIEERNAASRTAALAADVVVVVGDPTLKGLHALVRAERDLSDLGVPADRLVRVVNRAPRSPRARAELTSAIAALGTVQPSLSTVFVPERRQLDVTHSVAAPFPQPMVAPVTRSVTALLERSGA